MRVVPSCLLVGAACAVGACNDVGKPVPTDRAQFPTGLAVAGDDLVVVSSNFDLSFESGALLRADLKNVRSTLDGGADVVDDAYSSAVTLPSFGDAPVVDATGEHVFVTTRGDNQLHEVSLKDGVVSCGGSDVCGVAPFSLQLGQNDPFNVVLFGVDGDGVTRGMITHLVANQAEIFTFNPAADDASRLRVERDAINFGDNVDGVRGAVLRPAVAGVNEAQVFLTLEVTLDGVVVGTSVGVFDVPDVERGDNVTVTGIDVTAETGAIFARGMAVVTDADGSVSVVVALRGPDALARFAYNDRTGAFTLTHLTESCVEPTTLVYVDGASVGTAGVDRLLLTCQGGEVVQALDPHTLEVEDAVRFFGRDPYALAVDVAHAQAFVSFFLDGSIGVFDLKDADGNAKLIARGRIGTALPAPEDGRE